MLKVSLGRDFPLVVTAVLVVAGCRPHGAATEVQPAAPTKSAPLVPSASRSDVSTWASQLLVSVDAARNAISRHDKAAAQGAVNNALGFADKLGTRAIAPIYTEFSSVSVIGPVETAKASATSLAKPPPTAVRAVAGGYSRVSLDVNLARARLLAAKTELASGDLTRADDDLRAIQNGVTLESVSANLPLVRARTNVALAKRSAEAGKAATAKAQLLAAQRALAAFVQSTPGSSHTAEAKRIADDMARAAAAANDSKPLSVAQLDEWWTRLADWTDAA